MKNIKSIFIPLLFAMAIIFATVPFTSCEPEDDDPDEIDTTPILRKPNIYIYPGAEMQLGVSLEFPQGGEIITSIPEYGNGWSVSVDPDGLIDGKYSFLFYESRQPDVWQYGEGWLKSAAVLEEFFETNMISCGFAGREIDDFLEYWKPLLKEHPYYAIYPQDMDIIEEIVELHFTIKPDHIQRLYYVIKGYENLPVLNLRQPQQEDDFIREGFYVVEWGGILK